MKCVMFIACLIVATSGCGEEKPKPPPPPTDGITVIQPGAEPRRELRYALASGTTTPIEIAVDVDLKTADQEAKIPTMVMGADLIVTAADQLKLAVVTAGARPRTEDKSEEPARVVVSRQAGLLVGMVVTFTLTPLGAFTSPKVEAVGRDLSGPMQEQVTTLVQASEQLAMALPDKPVGVGAIWKHRRTMKQNQLTLVTNTTIEVTAIEGDKISFKSTTEMAGADQTITQGGESAKVTGVRGTGSQTGSFDLGKAVVLGETALSLSFTMIAGADTRPVKMDVVTRVTPRVDPVPVPTQAP